MSFTKPPEGFLLSEINLHKTKSRWTKIVLMLLFVVCCIAITFFGFWIGHLLEEYPPFAISHFAKGHKYNLHVRQDIFRYKFHLGLTEVKANRPRNETEHLNGKMNETTPPVYQTTTQSVILQINDYHITTTPSLSNLTEKESSRKTKFSTGRTRYDSFRMRKNFFQNTN